MKKYKKPDTTKLRNNPFSGGDFVVMVNRRVDNSRREMKGGEWVAQELEHERDGSVKLFTRKSNREKINALSFPSKEMFLWILSTVEWGSDLYCMNRGLYMLEQGVASYNTYKKAVDGLVNGGVIQGTTVKDVFWINPKIFFKGSRANKYPDKVTYYEPGVRDEEEED